MTRPDAGYNNVFIINSLQINSSVKELAKASRIMVLLSPVHAFHLNAIGNLEEVAVSQLARGTYG
jgi:hypothetical protein